MCPKKRLPFEVKRYCLIFEFECFPNDPVMHTERYSRVFLCSIHGRESQSRQNNLVAWCMIYCSLNNLNNKANTREAGEGE